MSGPLDVVALEIVWAGTLSVCNEQQVTLLRAALSTIVRESQDPACGLFDTRRQMVAQSLTGTPGHISAMTTGLRRVLSALSSETLHASDVLVTNHPWPTVGQVNDLTILTPVFREAWIVGYFASTWHAPGARAALPVGAPGCSPNDPRSNDHP